MQVIDVLCPERIKYQVHVKSKKRVFEQIASLLQPLLSEDQIVYEKLVERERLGNTALGKGVALPHCRCDTPIMQGAFFLLADPIDYDAHDAQKVDLVFALLVPEDNNEEYLSFVSQLAEKFRDSNIVNQLRRTASESALKQCLERLL